MYFTLRKSHGPLSSGTKVEIAPDQSKAGKGFTIVSLTHVSEALRKQNEKSRWNYILGEFEVPTHELLKHVAEAV